MESFMRVYSYVMGVDNDVAVVTSASQPNLVHNGPGVVEQKSGASDMASSLIGCSSPAEVSHPSRLAASRGAATVALPNAVPSPPLISNGPIAAATFSSSVRMATSLPCTPVRRGRDLSYQAVMRAGAYFSLAAERPSLVLAFFCIPWRLQLIRALNFPCRSNYHAHSRN